MTPNDAELLTNYVTKRSEAAFAELVRRHLHLVYAAAFRQVNGDSHLAEEIVQTVFRDLAIKARELASRPSLAGWLYTSARFAAAKAVRSDQRRRLREQMTSELHDDPRAAIHWEQLRPVLDEAMHQLDEPDREALLLRYFQNRELKAVGVALGLSDHAARKRVERALDKLRDVLARRGVTSTASALGTALASAALCTVPSGLSANVITSAVADAAVIGSGISSTFLQLMNATQIKVASAGAIALVGLTTVLFIEHNDRTRLASENSQFRAQAAELDKLRAENERIKNQEVDSAELARLRADRLELMRLRAEISGLKRRLSESTNALAVMPSTEPGAQPETKLAPKVFRFNTQTSAKVPTGQTLVSGPWPGERGKRVWMYLTPQLLAQGPTGQEVEIGRTVGIDGQLNQGPTGRQVEMKAVLIEGPEGQGLFRTPRSDSSNEGTTEHYATGLLDESQARMSLQACESIQGSRRISSPRVLAIDGQQAQIFIGQEQIIGEETVELGMKLEFLPVIAADGIHVSVTTQFNRLDPPEGK
jgi:RNA polymerase sigma factor (sigma-70 family)